MVGGFAAGWTAGYVLGQRVRHQAVWHYWALNVAAVVIGTTVNVIGLTRGPSWLAAGAIAFTVASITGLKYGRGVTTGRGSREAPADREPGPPSLWDD